MTSNSSTTSTASMDPKRMRIDLENLTPIAREFIATVIAIFTDPAPGMRWHREEMEAGRMALTVEDGEVTWINGPNSVENR